jgi:hypothetical protein
VIAAALTLPLRHPSMVVLLAVAATVLAMAGWRAVAFEPDVSRLLPQDHPQVHVQALLDDRSRPARTLWLLVRGDDVRTAVPGIAAALRASPLVAEVAATRDEVFGAAAARARAAPLWFLADDDLEALADALSPAGRRAAIDGLRADLADDPIAARELAVRDPLGLRWVLGKQDLAARLGLRADTELVMPAAGNEALLRLTGVADAYDADFSTALLAHVDAALAGRDVVMFGGYAVARADQARVRSDFERASLCAFVAIAFYLCWAMRGVRLPLLVQLPAALSILWAVPLANVLFGPLPTVAVAAVAVLCGLGVDFAIHYAARYRHERLTAGHADAARTVQLRTVPELLIDMATTAVTFVAIGAGQQGGLAKFGWLLALGLSCSVVLTTTVLPVLLAFTGTRGDPERSWIQRLADRWLHSAPARPVAWLAIAAAAVGLVIVVARSVPLRADGDALRPAGDPVTAARERIERTLGFGTIPVAVLWPAAADPTPLWHALHALQADGTLKFWTGLDRADTAGGRAAVAAFRARTAGFAEAAAKELEAAGFAAAAMQPALQDTAARFAADPEPAPPSAVDVAGTPQRVVVVWPAGKVDSASFAALETALKERAGGDAWLHGAPALARVLEESLRGDLGRACALAALLAIAMVSAWLRSLRHGLLALVPSTIGLVATLCVLVATGTPLTLVSFVAVPFVLGIGVDEGVHLVGHFRHGSATGAPSTGATGVGIVRTSVGTVLGFASLLLADSPGLVELGLLVAFGSLTSMLACLFVLAPLLAARRAQ